MPDNGKVTCCGSISPSRDSLPVVRREWIGNFFGGGYWRGSCASVMVHVGRGDLWKPREVGGEKDSGVRESWECREVDLTQLPTFLLLTSDKLEKKKLFFQLKRFSGGRDICVNKTRHRERKIIGFTVIILIRQRCANSISARVRLDSACLTI